MQYRYECEDGAILEVVHDPSGSMRCGIGATVWDCALVLCKYLELHPHIVRDKVVLDLSAGVGLVGLVAMKLGARKVLWSEDDQDSKILQLLQSNTGQYENCVYPLRWGNQSQMNQLLEATPNHRFDVILASDLVCWPEFSSNLSSTLSFFLQSSTSIALLCYEQRKSLDFYQGFLSLLSNEQQKIKLSLVPDSHLHEAYLCPDIVLVHLSSLCPNVS
jgi:hypothetical protein